MEYWLSLKKGLKKIIEYKDPILPLFCFKIRKSIFFFLPGNRPMPEGVIKSSTAFWIHGKSIASACSPHNFVNVLGLPRKRLCIGSKLQHHNMEELAMMCN